jgi:hypothetical protein
MIFRPSCQNPWFCYSYNCPPKTPFGFQQKCNRIRTGASLKTPEGRHNQLEDNVSLDKATCPQSDVWESFLFYLNGDVTENERVRIEQHLAMCSECRLFLRRIKLLKESRKRKAA